MKPVLIIDDDEDIRVLICSILEEEGIKTKTASNGLEGIDLFDQYEPDIVITDIRMPKMDGLEVLQDIKGKRPETEVIVITGHGELSMAIEALQMNASDFIQKPFQLNAFMVAFKRASEKLEMRDKLMAAQVQLLQSKKMASLGQLAAGIAHEINNPISFVNSNLGTIKKYLENIISAMSKVEQLIADDNNKLLEKLKEIKLDNKIDFIITDTSAIIDESLEGISRVRQIIQDLKSYSYVDKNQLESCNINDCIESSLTIIRNELKYHCEVIKNFSEIPEIQCFPQQIKQVIINILMNASHATEGKKGVIEIITSRAEDNGVEIIIKDNGEGIPAEIIDKIYDPFFTTKDVDKGTGLGLNIVYNLIEKHGGEINIESTVGLGTTCTIKLPPKPPNG